MFKRFERILGDAYGARGAQGYSISISEGSFYNIIFKIMKLVGRVVLDVYFARAKT